MFAAASEATDLCRAVPPGLEDTSSLWWSAGGRPGLGLPSRSPRRVAVGVPAGWPPEPGRGFVYV